MLTEKELEIRKIVWTELSDFYLDCELTDDDLKRKAILFRQSGLTMDQIKEINYYEVAPQLIHNLKSMAGVWEGFNQDGLHNVLTVITRRERTKPLNIFQRLKDFFHRKEIDYYTSDYFEKVEYYLLQL